MVDTTASSAKWIGKKATGEHNGSIKIKEGKLELAGNELTGGFFIMDMNSISCEDLPGKGKLKLENHLKSDDFFGVEKYPTATFTITKVKNKGNNNYQVKGNMTIKDITNEIEFTTQVAKRSAGLVAKASLTIDRSKFNVRYGSGSFFDELGDRLIYDDFELAIVLKSK